MGGCSYDRDVYSSGDSYSSSGFHSSTYSDAAFTTTNVHNLDPELLPLNRTLECKTKNSIVIGLDVTGSMGDSAKLLYDKLPMLWGQLEQQGYLKDFSISFAAVGDCTSDSAPFQICNYEEGKKIDSWIKKLYIEGGGGGQKTESYEMLAYYYANKTKFTYPKASEIKPFFFIIGDESPYDSLDTAAVKQHFGTRLQSDIGTTKVFEQVKSKYNFKHIHVPYSNGSEDSSENKAIEKSWKKHVGDDLIPVSEPKAVVDVILGVVAIVSGSRTLDQYKQDMRDRGQTEKRIENVERALKGLVATIKTNDKNPTPQAPKARGKTTRL